MASHSSSVAGPQGQGVKVLLVGDFPPPHGGVAVHVELLQRAVRKQGGECLVLDIGKGQLPADGVIPSGGPAKFAAQLGHCANKGYQIHVHTSGANPKSWMLAGLCATAGKLSRKPALITFHSGLGPSWLAGNPLRQRVARAVSSKFGTVIAVSQEIRDSLGLCGVSPEKVLVLPAFSPSFLEEGAPPEGFPELRREAAPLLCAMLAPGKVYGREILLGAFALLQARLPRARLALYGPGTSEVRAEGVKGFGELHRPAALAVMSASDLFVRPTLADGDSVSVREALALGCAVVATSVGTRPAGVRLCAPNDVNALAAALGGAAGDLTETRARAETSGDGFSRILAMYGFRPSEN